MKQLYIDFDGVILDTITKTYEEMKKMGISLKDQEKVIEYFRNADWKKIIEETEPINDSINEIKKICASKKFNVYILTHINSTNEMVEKIKYLHKNLPQVTIVSVPKEIPKTEVVNASAAILIDDYSGNIKEWQKKLGIGIKFVKELEGSDYPEITHLSEVIDMFKNSLKRAANEFKEPFFEGITNFYKNRYVLEDSIRRRIIAYMSMTTSDNLNYIIDLTQNSGYDFNYDEILGFALREIARRKTVFYPFVKQKQYTKAAGKFEDYLHAKNCQCIQTQLVLVKDFYRPVKQEQNALQVFLFGENRITAN